LQFQTPRADRAHNYLYVRLNNCGEPNAQDAASLLNDLRRRRNEADYDMRIPIRNDDASDAIGDAERIFQAFDPLSAALRVQITEAVKRYEQTIGDVSWTP